MNVLPCTTNCEFAFSEYNASAKHWQKDVFLIESNFSSDTTDGNYMYVYRHNCQACLGENPEIDCLSTVYFS